MLKGEVEMKVQFCINNYFEGCKEIVAEFDVVEMPTGDQINAIYDEVRAIISNGDAEDYSSVCKYVARKYLKLADNPVVLTLHI